MVDNDGVLISTNDMYAAWGPKPDSTITVDDIEFTESDTKDVIAFICDAGFDILIFMAYDDGEVY